MAVVCAEVIECVWFCGLLCGRVRGSGRSVRRCACARVRSCVCVGEMVGWRSARLFANNIAAKYGRQTAGALS